MNILELILDLSSLFTPLGENQELYEVDIPVTILILIAVATAQLQNICNGLHGQCVFTSPIILAGTHAIAHLKTVPVCRHQQNGLPSVGASLFAIQNSIEQDEGN
jgi:hypothetical protein